MEANHTVSNSFWQEAAMQAFNRRLNRLVRALSGVFESIMRSSRMIYVDLILPGK